MRRSAKLYALTLSLAAAAHLALLGLPLPDVTSPTDAQNTVAVELTAPAATTASDPETTSAAQATAKRVESIQTIAPSAQTAPEVSPPASAVEAETEAKSRSRSAQRAKPSPESPPPSGVASPSAKPATARLPQPKTTEQAGPVSARQALQPAPVPKKTDQANAATKASGQAEKLTQRAVQAIGDGYRQKLLEHLDQHQRYPLLARRQQQQGTVEVRFTLTPQGQLVGSSLLRSTPFALLNREALALLERATPFPPIPPPLTETAITWTLPVEFRLR
jgi:protein TonB